MSLKKTKNPSSFIIYRVTTFSFLICGCSLQAILELYSAVTVYFLTSTIFADCVCQSQICALCQHFYCNHEFVTKKIRCSQQLLIAKDRHHLITHLTTGTQRLTVSNASVFAASSYNCPPVIYTVALLQLSILTVKVSVAVCLRV